MRYKNLVLFILLLSNTVGAQVYFTDTQLIKKTYAQKVLNERILMNYILISQGVDVQKQQIELDDNIMRYTENLYDLVLYADKNKLTYNTDKIINKWSSYRIQLTNIVKVENIRNFTKIAEDFINEMNTFLEEIRPYKGSFDLEKKSYIAGKEQLLLHTICRLELYKLFNLTRPEQIKEYVIYEGGFELNLENLYRTKHNDDQVLFNLNQIYVDWKILKFNLKSNNQNALQTKKEFSEIAKKFDFIINYYESINQTKSNKTTVYK